MNPQTNVNVNASTNSFLKDSDLIFHMGKNGNVYSGGFAIDSSFMKNGVMSGGLYDKDSDADSDSELGPSAYPGGNVFTGRNFVVPPLWFHQGAATIKCGYLSDSDDEAERPVVNETLYNKLLDMARHGGGGAKHGEAKHGEAKHGNVKKRNTKKASAIVGEKRKYTRKHRKPESESGPM